MTIITLGKLKEAFFKEAEEEYLKRIRPFAPVNHIELTPEKLPDFPSDILIQKALLKEETLIFSKLREKDYIIPLVVEGKSLTSEELSKTLLDISLSGKEPCFIIGSSHGLSPGVKKRGGLNLSLSRLTLPHQLARVILAEQIYRVFTIQNKMKYHK